MCVLYKTVVGTFVVHILRSSDLKDESDHCVVFVGDMKSLATYLYFPNLWLMSCDNDQLEVMCHQLAVQWNNCTFLTKLKMIY